MKNGLTPFKSKAELLATHTKLNTFEIVGSREWLSGAVF